MSYEFKKLSEVAALTEVPEGAKVLAESNGQIVRVPGSGLGGSGGIKTAIIKSSDFFLWGVFHHIGELHRDNLFQGFRIRVDLIISLVHFQGDNSIHFRYNPGFQLPYTRVICVFIMRRPRIQHIGDSMDGTIQSGKCKQCIFWH